MERAVIELFDALRPAVDPVFLQSSRILQRKPPIIQEMQRRKFNLTLLPDLHDWEPPARPRSLRHLFDVVMSLLRGNLAVLRASRGMDILYVPGFRAGLTCMLAAIAFRLTGRRVVHHFHDIGVGTSGARFWLQLPTNFIHHTKVGYQAIAAQVPSLRRKRNAIIPPVLEVPLERPLSVEDRRQLEGRHNLFFVGQVSRHKGIDLLLQAFERIARECPDVNLHLVGGCAEDFRRELERQLTAAGLTDRVRFWGFRDDALQLLRHGYLYVHSSPPSRCNESFGRSVVEAMALGVPTVCFRSGALQEIIIHEQTGLLCEESAADLAKGMRRMLSSPEFRNLCGRQAIERFLGCYSTRVTRERWLGVFSNSGESATSECRYST